MARHAIAATGAKGRLAPPLDTLTDDPRSAIVEDITEPRKDIVAGYPGDLMPTDYTQRMESKEIVAVAAFIKAASGAKKGG